MWRKLVAVLAVCLCAVSPAAATCSASFINAASSVGIVGWPFVAFCAATQSSGAMSGPGLVSYVVCTGSSTMNVYATYNDNVIGYQLWVNGVLQNSNASEGVGEYRTDSIVVGYDPGGGMVYSTPVQQCNGGSDAAPTYNLTYYQDQVTGVYHYSANVTSNSGAITYVGINAVTNNNGARSATTIVGGPVGGGGQTNITLTGTGGVAAAPGGVGIEVQIITNNGDQFVIGGGAVPGASWGGPPVAGGSTTGGSSGGSTTGGSSGGSTTAGGGIAIGTPQTQSDPTSDPNAPSWWSWLWTAIKWSLVPSQAGMQNFSNSVVALGQAGPLGIGTAIKASEASCGASDGVSSLMPDSMSVTVAGVGAVTVDTPWKGWGAGHGPTTGGSTTIRTMLKFLLWLSVALVLLKWLRGRLQV